MSLSGPDKVLAAAKTMGLSIEIVTMPGETRTAAQAAEACCSTVAKILKSLIFEGKATGRPALFLLGGDKQVDMDKAAACFGEELVRADPKRVRAETGFAIGGVAPFGHDTPVPTWMDRGLLAHDTVWAAGGAPFKVFEVDPNFLAKAETITVADLA